MPDFVHAGTATPPCGTRDLSRDGVVTGLWITAEWVLKRYHSLFPALSSPTGDLWVPGRRNWIPKPVGARGHPTCPAPPPPELGATQGLGPA